MHFAGHPSSHGPYIITDPFQERMKSEKAISKLISKLADDNDGVRSAVYDALSELGKQGKSNNLYLCGADISNHDFKMI